MSHILQNNFLSTGVYNPIPKYIKYFQVAEIIDTLVIPDEKPSIEKIASIVVSPKVIGTELVTTPVVMSYEGQNLSGYKLIVDVALDEKIIYLSTKEDNIIHVAHYEHVITSVAVVIPEYYNEKSVRHLIRKNKFAVTPYVEAVYGVVQSPRSIYKYVDLLVDVRFLCK